MNHPLIARNEGINKWLSENPLVRGGGALVFAIIFVAMGISALVTGRAPAKRGPELKGGSAKLMGFVWLAFGCVCLALGLYKIVQGLA
jgi:hypothetical protein